MKIGLSLSRCVLDIVEGRVDMDDVLIIIARTDFDPHDDVQWQNIWSGYTDRSGWTSNPEWHSWRDKEGAEEKFRAVARQLWDYGKLHQPRKFGWNPARRREFWLETVLPSDELERNPAAREAWDRFQVVAGLTNVKLDREYQ
jgi:hypothetical protein